MGSFEYLNKELTALRERICSPGAEKRNLLLLEALSDREGDLLLLALNALISESRHNFNDVDLVKLKTWYHLHNLTDHYRDLTFRPMYQRGLKWMASRHDVEVRTLKIKVIEQNEDKLQARWAKELGPHWRDYVCQQD
jgi:5'(3')-deoxyribonucleotidase